MPQISVVARGAEGLLRAAVSCDVSVTDRASGGRRPQVRSCGNIGQAMNHACRAQRWQEEPR